MPTLLILEHVPHERLGAFEAAFVGRGLQLLPLRTFERSAQWPAVERVDGVVSMGGPMSVDEQADYPWMPKELALLREAVAQQLPILGVCLGAQLLAAALGAAVTKSPQKEIGWYPLMRAPGAEGDPLFAPFGPSETVLQWHGDTFALPPGAVRLASSPLCAEQAFRFQDHVYGLQFHLEVTEAMIRAWMRNPGNRAELTALRGAIDPAAIRRDSPRYIGRLGQLAHHVASAFAQLVNEAPSHRPRPFRSSATTSTRE